MELVELLLAANVENDKAFDGNGSTPLFMVSQNRHVGVAKRWLQHKLMSRHVMMVQHHSL